MSALTNEEKEAILVLMATDPAKAVRVLFPEQFTREFDAVHLQIIEDFFSDEPRTAVAAPRGIGKTTLTIALIAISILLHDCDYLVYISETATAAIRLVDNLKYFLTSNELIRELFGDVTATDYQSREFYTFKIAGREVAILPRGAGQQVRGLNFRGKRPDKIVCDDLESRENTGTKEKVDALKNWFFSDVYFLVDHMSSSTNFRFRVLGTVIDELSLLNTILDNAAFKSIRMSICDDNYETLAPNAISTEKIREIRQTLLDVGEGDQFEREYRNIAVSKTTRLWKDFEFSYFKEADESFRTIGCVTAVIVDPAKTVATESADTGFAVITVNTHTGKIYFREAFGAKLKPNEIYAESVSLINRFNASILAVEQTGLNEFVTQPFKDYLNIHGFSWVHFMPLTAKAGKDEAGKVVRVKSLYPYYASGMIFHAIHLKDGLYENQLRSFPRPHRWDVMDASGYMPTIFDRAEIFLSPQGTYDYSAYEQDDEYHEPPLVYRGII